MSGGFGDFCGGFPVVFGSLCVCVCVCVFFFPWWFLWWQFIVFVVVVGGGGFVGLSGWVCLDVNGSGSG